MTALTNKQKKEWAETLYKSSDITQKEIAAKVSVSEQTMTKWVKEGEWENLRKSLLTTKSEILRGYYDVLDKIRKKLKEENTIGDSKLADMNVKYTAAIKNLETDASLAELIEAGRLFVNDLMEKDPQFALRVLNEYDEFIKNRLKRF
jgi:DNA-binding XRE family transcriptional regulator